MPNSTEPNVYDAAVDRFLNKGFVYYSKEKLNHGNVSLEGKTWINGGKKDVIGPGIDCSALVQQAMLAVGYDVKYLWTGSLTDKNGNLTDESQAFYAKITPDEVRKGDVVVFAPDEAGQGHVGIIESYNKESKKGSFFGSQTSTGPAVAEFGPNAGYWAR